MTKNIKYVKYGAVIVGVIFVYKFINNFLNKATNLAKDSAEYAAKKTQGYTEEQIIISKQAAQDLYNAFNVFSFWTYPITTAEDEDEIIRILNTFNDAKLVRLLCEDFKRVHPKRKTLKAMVNAYLSVSDINQIKRVVIDNLV